MPAQPFLKRMRHIPKFRLNGARRECNMARVPMYQAMISNNACVLGIANNQENAMKADLQILKLEPSIVQRVVARAENFLKAAGSKIHHAQLAHLQRLQAGASRTGHRGVFLL